QGVGGRPADRFGCGRVRLLRSKRADAVFPALLCHDTEAIHRVVPALAGRPAAIFAKIAGTIRRYMLPRMDDDELNELCRRREACLRDGIPRDVYVEALKRAHELRRAAFAAAFQAFLRALRGGRRTDPSGDNSMIVREWRGWAALSKADDYPKHFRDKVIPELCR